MSPPTTRHTALTAQWLVALAYTVLGAAGLALAIPPGYASPVFPATGFALAVALYFGPRVIPAVWFGSMVLNTGLALQTQNANLSAFMVATGIGLGAACQTWLGQHLVRRWSDEKWRHLDQEKIIFHFFLLGGVVACLMSATFGVGSLYLAGFLRPSELLYTWWIWYVGDTLGVLIVAPLTVGLLLRQHTEWLSRLKALAWPVVGMFSLAIAAFLGTARWEADRYQTTLDNEGNNLALALERQFITHRETLAALSRAIEINPNLRLDQFARFTEDTLKDNKDIFALSFNRRVEAAERPRFEQGMRQLYGDQNFQIRERNPEGQLVRAADRPFYVPVAYISPLAGNRAAVGFDIHSEPKRQRAIERATASGRVVATEPIRLVQDQKTRPGVLILTPTYHATRPGDTGTGPRQQLGFAVAVLKIDEMVQVAAQGLLPAGLQFTLEDPGTDEASRQLYRSDGGSTADLGTPSWEKTLQMADREWRIRLYVTDVYQEQHRSWIAWAVGVVGLVFVALLQMFLLLVTGRAVLIKRKVDEQTTEIQGKSAALAQSETKYRTVVENLNEVIFQTDAHGICTFLNAPWTTVSGHSVNEGLGQPLRRFIHPEDQAAFDTALDGLLQQQVPDCLLQLRLLHRNGRHRWVELSARLLPQNEEHRASTIGTLLDVTERREADDKLRQAMHKAEAANQAKTQFLATMSHELRTPMNAILGMAQLLQHDDTPAEERREYTATILNSGHTLLTLLNDILDLSKVEAGKFELTPTVFSARQLAQEMKTLFQESAASKSVALELDCGDLPDLHYRGDATRLRQMLSNLLSNAIKFTAQGRITLQVRERRRQDTRAVLEFAVSDTGIGIPKDKLNHLFRPFEQVDSSNTRHFGGTGLGLSIVKSLAELMNGTVGVDSTAGEGSRFWFTVEVGTAASSSVSEGTAQAPHIPLNLVAPAPGTLVMVVEDYVPNQTVAKMMLTKMGFSTAVFNNGQEALWALERGLQPALILMDLQMPVMDGLTATQLLREKETMAGQPRTPVIALTANAFEEDVQRCRAAGMDDFVPKPIQLKLLQATVHKWLTPVEQHPPPASDASPT